MKRPHPDAALAAACLLGLALLAAAHTWTLPTPVAAEDAPAHEGARVVLEARVLEARHGARGRYLLLADDTARLPALGPPGEGPAVGDVVRIEGIVARDGDGGPLLSFERVVTSARAASTVRSPADVAAAPDLHGGNPLRLEGLVRDGRLHGGGASLALAGAPPPPDATDRVEAVGRLRYQPRLAAYVLVVDAWTLPSRS